MLPIVVFLIAAVAWLAYSNGANDNFKGVATLLGSGTADYRKAIIWATLTTFLGSIAAIFSGEALVSTFSGKGIVPDSTVLEPFFLLAVGAGAASTVFLASRLGIPVSTTHAMMGALAGAGLVATGGDIYWGVLGEKFIVPLLASPFLALIISFFLTSFSSRFPSIHHVDDDACICVGEERPLALANIGTDAGMVTAEGITSAMVGSRETCAARFGGRTTGLSVTFAVDLLHYLSAGAVGFARGLNDTPKVIALIVAARIMDIPMGLFLAGGAIALGGLLSSRAVAETMGHKITEMDRGSGFTGNLVTALLVIFASRWGVPVSTTHVSCGSLFGIGVVNGRARWKTIGGIFLAWVTTVPLAALLSGAIMATGIVVGTLPH